MAVSWPFDSTLTQDSEGNPIYSRTYSSDVIARILTKYFRNGVFANPSTGFQVTANSEMTVLVKAGAANINGRQVYEETDRTLAVQAASASLDRIDTVVLRLDLSIQKLTIDLYVVPGTPAATPAPPELTRNASVWELGLANLFIAKNATSISQQRITDTRLDSIRCGIVASIIGDVDTTTLYAQIQADLASFKATEQANFSQWSEEQMTEFDTWFANVKNTLGEDVAGELYNLITELGASLRELPQKLTKLTIVADAGLIGQTVTVANGDLSYTVAIDETMTSVIDIPQLDTWVISNSLTDKTVTVEIQYYGHYKVNVKAYREYGVRIDTNNSNPATCCSYIGEAPAPGSTEWDTWFGIRPCLFKNGAVVGYLDPDNFAKFEDGSPADITSGTAGDVMIEFPRRGLSIITIGSNINIMMTDDEELTGYEHNAHRRGNVQKENFYFSAYKGSVTDNKLRSLSGKTPSSNLTIGGYRNYAHANGIGYEISAFYQILYIQALYILKYANLNSQVTIGKGRTAAGNTAAIATGGTDASGMTWGGTDTQHMKLFGIEDFWGNIWDWFDGAVTNSARNLLTATDDFNDGGSGYSNQGLMYSANISSAFISKVFGTTDAGFMPNLATGSETTYFCDGVWLSPSRVAKHGGGWNDAGRAGAFCVTLDDSSSTAAPYVGARLSFI